jgi:putative membrane protein insertion efficiency factor
MIKIYQNNAPKRLRASCRFEPSCSNYMAQAIEKYGPFIGVKMGVNRLFRCRIPNGGIDYP